MVYMVYIQTESLNKLKVLIVIHTALLAKIALALKEKEKKAPYKTIFYYLQCEEWNRVFPTLEVSWIFPESVEASILLLQFLGNLVEWGSAK